jgi:poly-gamma-glutamate biosynthesis protein PgsC/CapC
LDPLTLSIGVGLVVGLIFVSFLGLSTGGMIVPGYLALQMGSPLSVTVTIVAAIVIYAVVRLLSRYMIIYGRRRIALTILLAFISGILMNELLIDVAIHGIYGHAVQVIGYIIPGLIALSMDRQGIIETIGSLLIATIFVRLVLIILIGNVIISL